MTQALARYSNLIAWSLTSLFFLQLFLVPVSVQASDYDFNHIIAEPVSSKKLFKEQPAIPVAAPEQPTSAEKVFGNGPTQPEMQAFTSVNNTNMVDLFSGDFTYSIPLMDVGGYPINLAYRSGVTMDQEASWVGLGWNVNPGTVTRNLRGLPDDFDGLNDSVKKIKSIRENKTVGVTGGVDVELVGLPVSVGASMGVFHNNYKGWGIEHGLNASINSGTGAKGPLSGGLSITNNSQEGLTITPSLSVKLEQENAAERAGLVGSLSTSLSYNSRSGLKSLQLTPGLRLYGIDLRNQRSGSGTVISFASPSYTPSISVPFTSKQFSFTGKLGQEFKFVHPNYFVSGYVSKQFIAAEDTLLGLPAYGYLHYQQGAKNKSALLDYNREKELVYREKPAVPHIAIPVYTYDAFSITGEGTGGMFRAYRGDIGFVHDHFIRSKDESDRVSIDVGLGDLVHGGVDLNINRAFTQNGPWLNENTLKNVINFRDSTGVFEHAYFRNPGEKSINSKAFYDALGGDDVVAVELYQASNSSASILATNNLTRYRNKQAVGKTALTPQNSIKTSRDKRTQVISYLTAKEAAAGGLSKYIESYTVNQFDSLLSCRPDQLSNVEGAGVGLPGQYFKNTELNGPFESRTDATVNFNWDKASPIPTKIPENYFSIRWSGRVMAPVTGTYTFYTTSDDGVRFWLNDRSLVTDWTEHAPTEKSATVNLIEGEMYDVKIDYYDKKHSASFKLEWAYPGQPKQVIPQTYLFAPPSKDTFALPNVVKETRVNRFRKENHISQIDVLNSDGRKYVYGIPVYNLKQREATFSASSKRGNEATGLVGYTHGFDNSSKNLNGQDHYYNSEEVPAYAHSFLLTGILSPDYVDLTGNGISGDDPGNAVKMNYSKIAGINNPYKWRAPYTDSVSYNEGLKTDTSDDKGNYVYGEKELWYLHSIESKTMIATFTVEDRLDLASMNEAGVKINDGSAKRLKEINLYSKADFLKNPKTARPIKTVHFEYSYELCKGVNKPLTDSGKLTLKKVWFSYNGNKKGKDNPYVFNYSSNNPSYNIKSFDRWGNYKDPLQNPGSVSNNIITNAEYPYSLQDSTLAAINAGAWSLDSILLPSGGAMKIKYESDDYGYVQHKRAMQMFKLYGLGSSTNLSAASNKLYEVSGDNLYVFVSVPQAVTDKADAYKKYLSGIEKLYFRMFVKMPSDKKGKGSEYVSCYADIDSGAYGVADPNIIWIKLSGISMKGDGGGSFSPLAKAGIQFLRLNLPSKAYPGSETGENIDLEDAVKMLMSMAASIETAFISFDEIARASSYAKQLDTSKSFVRLNSPVYKKYGGGHRVKKITIYDNWDKMTRQRAASYGQEYIYTTRQKETNQLISSGVASYEPGIGGEENPFHEPIEYVEKISAMGPVSLAYSEEPLGESFFPAAGVGYSKVRVRTINHKNIRSANGYEETNFYTAYDFPTFTDRSLLDNDTKKRYKPGIANFLRINAKHYLTLSQGFKVELNDMHGKLRSQASYAENDPVNPVTYTETIYKVEDPLAEHKRLSNTAMVIQPGGIIDSAAVIGKDLELMVDMREQLSITNGYNISLNSDMFSVPFIPPFFLIPSLLNLAQREENQYRSAATVKIIQRYGIVDSVIHIDKGSKISTSDLLYDSETGDVLLTRTQNEFNDPVYSFSYPSHWAYDGMSHAYKNIGVALKGISIRNGRIISGLNVPESTYFSSGDELLVAGKLQTGAQEANCVVPFSTFPTYTTIWAVDSSVLSGGPQAFYFIDREGKPYNGFDISLKIIRSGRRNINASIGSLTFLENPLQKDVVTGMYGLVLDSTRQMINATAAEFSQFWKVDDIKKKRTSIACAYFEPQDCANDISCTCNCLKKLFDYLIASRRLFIKHSQAVTVSALVTDANNAGYNISVTDCELLQNNANGLFYALTFDQVSQTYRAKIGKCTVKWTAPNAVDFYNLVSQPCDSLPRVQYYVRTGGGGDETYTVANSVPSGPNATFSKTFYVTKSLTYFDDGLISGIDTGNTIKTGRAGTNKYSYFMYRSLFKFDSVTAAAIPANATINSALLYLYAAPEGFRPPSMTNAHTTTLFLEEQAPFYLETPSSPWSYSTSFQDVQLIGSTNPRLGYSLSSVNQNKVLDIKDFVNDWLYGNGNNGIKLNFTPFMADTMYSTFASQRHSNASLRPMLVIDYTENTMATLEVESCMSCDTVRDVSCKSIVADTTFNPYVTGVLGNWRGDRSFLYYGSRAESDPLSATNIRSNGAYKSFMPFWNFDGNWVKPSDDTTRWVWKSAITMFNNQGAEIEGKDPLGRYNAGLYGYNQTLPVAVTQNSRYRESAYEGFEDYGFATQLCDTACSAARHMDFSGYRQRIDTLQKHSGTASLKLTSGQQAALNFDLATENNTTAQLIFSTKADACATGGNVLDKIKAQNSILLPGFSPLKGKRMVVSAWVKEEQTCNCVSYSGNRIVVLFSGGAGLSLSFAPTGNIIEGWQRYEGVFDIPSDATSMTVSLESTGSSTVYFDDLRIHPFNANMRSFVYDPVSLRLMAELDENNHATFFEYDDEGTLIRVKKETERGIKTIKETRSALVKPF